LSPAGNKKEEAKSFFPFCLVEAGGIEPPSENLLIRASPGEADYLSFPMGAGNRHPEPIGILFMHDGCKGISLRARSSLNDASTPGRDTPGETGCPAGRHHRLSGESSIICV